MGNIKNLLSDKPKNHHQNNTIPEGTEPLDTNKEAFNRKDSSRGSFRHVHQSYENFEVVNHNNEGHYLDKDNEVFHAQNSNPFLEDDAHRDKLDSQPLLEEELENFDYKQNHENEFNHEYHPSTIKTNNEKVNSVLQLYGEFDYPDNTYTPMYGLSILSLQILII